MTTQIANGSEPHVSDRRGWGARILLFLVGCNLVSVLAVLPWNHFAVEVEGIPDFVVDRTGVQSPDASMGIAALVLAAGLALWAAAGQVGRGAWADVVRRFDRVVPPVAALATLALLVLKATVRSEFLGTGAWVALVLAVVLVLSALQLRRAGHPHAVVASK